MSANPRASCCSPRVPCMSLASSNSRRLQLKLLCRLLTDARLNPAPCSLGMRHVLRIGFLNETDEARVAARLPQYEAAFDAVILGDRSFDWLLSLLRSL